MASTILAKQCGIGNYEWLSFDSGAVSDLIVSDAEELQQRAEAGADITLLVSAELVSLSSAGFEQHERKMLRQTLPYTLEDECVDDVDNLHFALGEVSADHVPLAVIDRQQLEDIIADNAQQQLDVQQLVCELQFIPLADNVWTLQIDDQRWLIRISADKAYAFDADTAALALQLLLDEQGQVPEQLIIYAAIDNQAAIIAQLPELLKGVVNWHEADYWQTISEGFLQSQQARSPVINLLQGDYVRSLPWAKWWGFWRVAVILFLIVIAIQFASTLARLQIAKQKNVELRAQTEQAYRKAIPKGAVMDPEKQLSRKVNAMKGSGGDGLMVLLAQIAEVFSTIDGLSLQSLNYSEKQTEVRVTILAAGFNDVETARANLEKLGLKAELTGSSADDGKTRARLRIRG